MFPGAIYVGHAGWMKHHGEQTRRTEQQLARERERIQRLARRAKGELSDDDKALLALIDKQLHSPLQRESSRTCPGCGKPFVLLRVGDITIDTCLRCKSCWFDPGELSLLTGEARDVPSAGLTDTRKSDLACPVCGELMKETVYLKPHNILVDRCPDGHGVYLENHELVRVLRVT